MDSSEFDCYVLDLDSIKDDMITMEKLLKRLQDGSEQIKTVHSATSVKELQDMMDSDIDDVFIVAKSITQCLEGLQRSNPSADMKASGPGSSVDRTRMNVVMEIGKKLKEMMDGFQWLGLKIVAAHKETVESIYYSVTKEKQSMESIEKFVASGEIETFLRVAGDEEGNVRILDVVQEIQERIKGSKYMQKSLVELQSMFLGMVALVEAQRKKLGGGGKEKTGGAVGGVGGGGGGRGGEDLVRKAGVGVGVSTQLLHSPAYDHEREAKKRAIIAIILTAISIVVLILILAKLESDDIEKE